MMHATLFRIAACAAPLALWAAPAFAYVGPGAGITLLGALWGVLIAIGVALGFLLLWPLRRVLFARRQRSAPQAGQDRTHDGMSSAKPGNP